jgi:hypothetical protein
MRRLFALLAAAGSLAAAPAANAQEELRWLVDAAPPDYAALLYALPQSDFIAVGFDCIPGREGVGINFDYRPTAARDGMVVAMELSSAVGNLTVDATGYVLEMSDGFILSAITPLDGPLISILSGGGTLAITVEDVAQQFPLPDAEALGAFATACRTIL